MEEAEECRLSGNALLSKGDFADAVSEYDKGLVALLSIRENAHPSPEVSRTRAALHLNASLAHLRRGNLASAVDHATGALAAEPKNVKALYRRGMARKQLAEHQGEAQLQLAQDSKGWEEK